MTQEQHLGEHCELRHFSTSGKYDIAQFYHLTAGAKFRWHAGVCDLVKRFAASPSAHFLNGLIQQRREIGIERLSDPQERIERWIAASFLNETNHLL
jgi:hypothetical protein